MKTILFNTTTEQPVSQRRYEGGYNAVYPNGTLPNYIVELEVIDTLVPEYNSELQYTTSVYEKQELQWVKVWTVIDKTPEEIANEINQQAQSEAQQINAVLVNKLLRQQLPSMPDEEMYEYTDLFLPFMVGENVKNATDSPTGKADIRRWKGFLYKCIISHTTQSDWTPDVYAAGWSKIPEPGTVPEWSSFESHEFVNMEIGTAVMDEGTKYYLTDPSQGHWKPSGDSGHFGWSTTNPV